MAQGSNPSLASLTTALAAASLLPGGKSAPAVPVFALGYDDGGVDVHALSPRFAEGQQGGVEAETAVLAEIVGRGPGAQAAHVVQEQAAVAG